MSQLQDILWTAFWAFTLHTTGWAFAHTYDIRRFGVSTTGWTVPAAAIAWAILIVFWFN